MLRVFPYITIVLLVIILLTYLQNYDPDFIKNKIIEMDVLNILPATKEEHDRKYRIGSLTTIGALEKQALYQHTVFIGATAEMVELALGMPKQVLFKEGTDGNILYYVYFLANDRRPTIFEFGCNKATNQCDSTDSNYRTVFRLDKAYKKSVIDVENLNVQEGAPAMPAAQLR